MPLLGAVDPGGATLDQQSAMTHGRTTGAPGSAGRRQAVARDGVVGQLGDAIDSTPRFLAGLILGAALTIVALRLAGFRFSFGASLGGGA